MADGSVTNWIRELKSGNEGAFSHLVHRFFHLVRKKAKHQFGDRPRIVRDEEDIALSVLGVLAKRQHLDHVNDRDDLARLLTVITLNKVKSEKRSQTANCRGSGHVCVLSDLSDDVRDYINNLKTDEPTPEVLAQISEQHSHLMSILPDDQFREIARLRLLGKRIDEIADYLDVVPRTINRKIKIIRDKWIASMQPE